ncbi:hypothetical protein CEP49_06355 [Mergibacter septicus]|uniref:YfgM family protein n=1 Tax=Mergibacter septicus TaxID=221402 RepID=UPI0011791A91|nr:YfgM family protein [Mergibacter septicus]AWX14198.1 hypothetical protein CEP49_06355 [Mergibacter septicus]
MAYTTDEQLQVDEIKNWWKENGKVIIFAVILAILGVLGWRYWQQSQTEKIYQTSTNFDQVVALYQQDPQTNVEQLEQFSKNYPDTSYAVFALLIEAQNAVTSGNFTQAEAALTQALSNTRYPTLVSIIALRLAAVQIQLNQFDAATASLGLVKESGWQGRKAILSGDIAMAKGDLVAAKQAYQTALETANPFEMQWLKIRLNNL